jgi:hypothetical protein
LLFSILPRSSGFRPIVGLENWLHLLNIGSHNSFVLFMTTLTSYGYLELQHIHPRARTCGIWVQLRNDLFLSCRLPRTSSLSHCPIPHACLFHLRCFKTSRAPSVSL